MFTKNLKQLKAKDVYIVGGKGASLGEMTKIGINVPAGFVVTTNAFNNFLERTKLDIEIEAILKEVKLERINLIDSFSKKIRNLIKKVKFPKDIADEILKEFRNIKTSFVAVRSSATVEDSSVASWAGELESYLNIRKENLLEAVKKCWSSLFTSRAIIYRIDKGMRKKSISVAVVIQEMVQSEISGIIFTVHPVIKDYDQMVVEAGYGLGEAIVGGLITPDTYIINKKTNKILEKNISEQSIMIVRGLNGTSNQVVAKNRQKKQKLTDQKILKLVEICKNIEKHYKKPQDIEWALKKGIFYITQSRPITSL
jgi:pyruvate, water dikinase